MDIVLNFLNAIKKKHYSVSRDNFSVSPSI